MKVKLGFNAVLFTLLLPGMVTIVVPYFILRITNELAIRAGLFLQTVSIIFWLAGMVILLYCIWGFAFYGKGTLAAIAPPKILVVKGLYRYTRNPMYLAVILMLLSESIFFISPYLLIYTVLVFLSFNLYVLFYEEPHLKKVFGEEYRKYNDVVPRWSIKITGLVKQN